MDQTDQPKTGNAVQGRGAWQKTGDKLMPAVDRLTDLAYDDARVIKREVQLFVGMAFLLVGFFHFKSGKYCDGNAADYLSCTRPSTYYYYGGLEIILLILGSFLVVLWFLKSRARG